MMLADHGADVISVERPGGPTAGLRHHRGAEILERARRSIILDLKQPEAIEILKSLLVHSDGFIEGFRPGVMERLGLGPSALLSVNPSLVYGRMTGWGQSGPLAKTAGHDLNYIALTGALHAFGRAGEKPTPPINLVGDFGGGGMLLAFGMVAGILAARQSGKGQVVDCAMTDGAALLMSMMWGLLSEGKWRDQRGVNLLDTGAHFYEVYETKDGHFISIAAIEPDFYAKLRRLIGLEMDDTCNEQMNSSLWPSLKDRFAAIFKQRTRDDWCKLLEGTDACFAPVLSMNEAPLHPHNKLRETYIEVGGVTQPAPAPRFSGTPAPKPRTPVEPGSDTDTILRAAGYDDDRIAGLRRRSVVG